MSTSHRSHPLARQLRRAAAVALVVLGIPGLALADSNWSSVGSTGTPDEICTNRVSLNNNDAALIYGTTATFCTLRYQVNDIYTGGGILSVQPGVRYTDNGIYAEVRMRLRSHNTATGALATLASFTSNSYPAAATPQTRYLPLCVALNFNINSYFIEVDLVRSSSPVGVTPGLPVIGQLRLVRC